MPSKGSSKIEKANLAKENEDGLFKAVSGSEETFSYVVLLLILGDNMIEMPLGHCRLQKRPIEGESKGKRRDGGLFSLMILICNMYCGYCELLDKLRESRCF